MRNNKTLPIGEKLKQVREARGMTQKEVAAVAMYSAPSISSIEAGRMDCEADGLLLVRKALNIEKMPLLESERKVFKDKLLIFCDLILDWKIEEAKEMQEELSDIEYLPFECELNTYYKLFECLLLLTENNFDEAAAILKTIAVNLQETDDEITYYYYYNMGILNSKTFNDEVAMEFFLKANRLIKSGYKGHEVLHYNTASCLMGLGFLVQSVSFLEKWHEMFSSEKSDRYIGLWIDELLARNYIRLNRFQDAQPLLEKCLKKAKTLNNKRYIGIIFYDYGLMYKTAGAGSSALEYLDKALECFKGDEINYLEALYLKVLCCVDMKYSTLCVKSIEEGKKLAKGNEMYTILFESAKHLTSLSNHKSTQYIEGIAIPYLVSNFSFYAALVYSETLRKYFEGKGDGSVKKALLMSDVTRGIYERMLNGGDFTLEFTIQVHHIGKKGFEKNL